MTCAVCGSPGRGLFRAHGHEILGCERCGHRFAAVSASTDHVARVYADEYFFGGGAGYDDYAGEAGLLRERGAAYARLVRAHLAPGAVLDVGAAAGFLLEGFLSAGWKGRGVEPNARMAALANARLGPVVGVGTLESFTPGRTFDLVLMLQVVAHFQDPRRALAQAAALTRAGGFWLVETWDRESWTARAFGRHWHEYSPPSVLHFFSREGLRQLAGSLGFREVATGRARRRIGVAHARSLLQHKLESGPLGWLGAPLRLLPDSLGIPYPGDDLFWALFRDERVPL
jgi:SAM-dependent methyltransferase